MQTKRVLEANGRTNVHINADEIKEFAKTHWKESPKARWNGRQVRSAFHTAVAIAEFNAREPQSGSTYDHSHNVRINIGKEQFEKIAKTASEFDAHMAETMGATFDDKASKEGFRKEEPKKPKSNGKSDKKKSKASKKAASSGFDGGSSENDCGRNGGKKSKGKNESEGSDSDDGSD